MQSEKKWSTHGIVVKIGGELAVDYHVIENMSCEIEGLRKTHPCVLVHGGGAEVSELMRQVGIEPNFQDGIRITSPEEMVYVENVLSGKVNKRLVRFFQFYGVNAVGLSGADGQLVTGRSFNEGTRTGNVTHVEPRLINILIDQGYFPILSSTSMDEYGEGLNINADEVAFELAGCLRTRSLIFLSNTPGVLKDGAVIPALDPGNVMKEIESGNITDGMIPKVRASVDAIAKGVEKILIGTYREYGDLQNLLSGKVGTKIVKSLADAQ